MKKLLFTLLVFLTTVSVAYGANNLWEYYLEQGFDLPSVSERAVDYYGHFGRDEIYRGTAEQNIRLLGVLQSEELTFGAWNPVGGLTYRLQASIGKTSTSIKLSSFKNRSDILLTMTIMGSDIGYGTISPQTTRSEFVSFTGVTQNADGTATLTGVSRGLSDISPFTASTTMANTHPGQSVFILSDSPSMFEEYASRRSNDEITGAWNFSTNLPYSALAATTSQQFVNKGYVDSVANQGASTSTELTGGLVELATQAETASSTDGGAIKPLVLQAKNATSSPGDLAGFYTVVTENDGTINHDFIGTDEAWDWTGANSHSATSTFNSGVDIEADSVAPLALNGIETVWPSSAPTVSTSSVVMDTDGTVRYINPAPEILFRDGASYTTTAQASTSLVTYVMPANTMGVDSRLEIYANCAKGGSNNIAISCEIELGTGAATTSIIYFAGALSAEDLTIASLYANISNRGSLAVQRNNSHFLTEYNNSAGAVRLKINTEETTYNTATQLYINFRGWTANSNTTAGIDSITITKY